MTEQNLILLYKEKTIVPVCTTNVRSEVCLLFPGTICFSNVLFSTSFLYSSWKTFFSLA